MQQAEPMEAETLTQTRNPTPNNSTPEELVAQCRAPVKKEFLLFATKRALLSATARAEGTPAQVECGTGLEAIGSEADALPPPSVGSANGKLSTEKKSRRQLKRERKQAKNSPANICTAVARKGDVSVCPFGNSCKFNHDLEAFLKQKPPDLPGECPFLGRPFPCPFGLSCRFFGTHTNGPGRILSSSSTSENGATNGEGAEEGENVPLEQSSSIHEMGEELITGFEEKNGLSKAMQKQLWKRTVMTKRAEAALAAIGWIHRGDAITKRRKEELERAKKGPLYTSKVAVAGEEGGSMEEVEDGDVDADGPNIKGCCEDREAAGDYNAPDGNGFDRGDGVNAPAINGHGIKRISAESDRYEVSEMSYGNTGVIAMDSDKGEGGGVMDKNLEVVGAEGPSNDAEVVDTVEMQVTGGGEGGGAEGRGSKTSLREAGPQGSTSVESCFTETAATKTEAAVASAQGGTVETGVNCSLNKNVGSKSKQKLEKKKQQHEPGVALKGVVGEDEDQILPMREKKRIDFKNKIYIAPLTTVGNLPFRRVCKDMGADITCGEMAMCSNLLQGQASEWALLRRHLSEDVFGVQICGAFPDQLSRTAETIEQECGVDFIDINVGCPIDIVVDKGAGSCLLTRPNRLEQCLRAASTSIDCTLTAKMRMAYFEGRPCVRPMVKKLPHWGVRVLTIHGRSRQQRYSRPADWEYIRSCAEEKPDELQLIGNGDVFSFQEWNKGVEVTDSCMLARGALIKPWLPTEIKEQRLWDISASERFEILRSFSRYGLQHWGSDTKGVETTRRFLLEWLSYLHRYIPVGLLEILPQRLNWRPPLYCGRSDMETLLASDSAADWVRISEMLLGPPPSDFMFTPKHKSNAYDKAENG